MALEVNKTNEIEKPADAQPAPGAEVEVSNPIVYYSDQPGAGPNDTPVPDAPEPAPASKPAPAATAKPAAKPSGTPKR